MMHDPNLINKGAVTMHLHQATEKERQLIFNIILDGKQQLSDAGIDQWQTEYPKMSVIDQDIAKGQAFIFDSEDHETVGTAAIIKAPDEAYDAMTGEWSDTTAQYMSIHRVAIYSHHKGKGYASRLFEALFNYIEQHHPEITSIRIDTHQDNDKMQYLIKKVGFEEVGKMHGFYHPNDVSYVYEKLIGAKIKVTSTN